MQGFNEGTSYRDVGRSREPVRFGEGSETRQGSQLSARGTLQSRAGGCVAQTIGRADPSARFPVSDQGGGGERNPHLSPLPSRLSPRLHRPQPTRSRSPGGPCAGQRWAGPAPSRAARQEQAENSQHDGHQIHRTSAPPPPPAFIPTVARCTHAARKQETGYSATTWPCALRRKAEQAETWNGRGLF